MVPKAKVQSQGFRVRIGTFLPILGGGQILKDKPGIQCSTRWRTQGLRGPGVQGFAPPLSFSLKGLWQTHAEAGTGDL